MTRTRISSEAIASVGYDAPARILEIEFSSGEIYRYFDVVQGEVDGLFRADSRGAYLNETHQAPSPVRTRRGLRHE